MANSAVKYREKDQQYAPRALNEFNIIPPIAEVDSDVGDTDEERGIFQDAFADEVWEFSKALMGEVADGLRQSDADRNEDLGVAGDFDARRERALNRSRAQVDPTFDDNGSVVRSQPDSHSFLGITMGWIRRAVNLMGAWLNRALFESSQRSFLAVGRGSRQENRKIVKVAAAVMDDMLERADYKKALHLVTKNVATYGTAYLRYEMGIKREMERAYEEDPMGERVMTWRESEPILCPLLTYFPIEHVYVRDYGQPRSKDQQGVWWVTPDVTLTTLEGEEAISWTDEAGAPREHGKWRNLETVRRHVQELQEGASGKPSRATLVEYEGPLPMVKWARDGVLNYDILKFFGCDVGVDPDPVDDVEMVEEFGRRAQAIPYWHVAYLTEMGSKMNKGTAQAYTGSVLIRCEPARNRTPRSSLYAFKYAPDGARFFGMSVTDLGYAIEGSGDQDLNAQSFVAFMNANAPRLVNSKVLRHNKTAREVGKELDTPNAMVAFETGPHDKIDARELVAPFERKPDPEAYARIELKRGIFDDVVGISASTKGKDRAVTGTLGEIQHNFEMNKVELQDVVLAAGQEWARLVSHIWDDVTWYMGTAQFGQYAAEISGVAFSDIEKIMPSLEGIEGEVKWYHPLAAAADRSMMTAMLTNIYSAFPNAPWDAEQFSKILVEIAGYSRPDELYLGGSLMDPDDEHQQFSRGSYVKPDLREDINNHLFSHNEHLNDMRERAFKQGWKPTLQLEFNHTVRHLEATMDMVRRFLQMQPEMADMQSEETGPAAPSSGPGGKETPTPQQGELSSAPKMLTGASPKPIGNESP